MMFSLFREEMRAKNINAYWRKKGIKANARAEYADSYVGFVVRSDLTLRWKDGQEKRKKDL